MKLKKYAKAGWNLLSNKDYRFLFNANRGRYDNMPDDEYLKRMFKASVGYDLNLDKPRSFNEKLQWLKLYNRNPDYTKMVDKCTAKEYAAQLIGEQHIIPTLAVYDSPKDIDFASLPNQFVLKCNHNSGLGMYICKNKDALSKQDILQIKKNLEKGLKQDYYLHGREWPYKNVQRKIMVEQYMTDGPDKDSFTDYKFFCFNGYVDCVMVCLDRNMGDTKYYFYDKNWKLCRYNKRGKEAPENFTLPKPIDTEKMFEIASVLSKGIPFARIDLYNSNGHIYFGEITFFPDSGFDPNLLKETDKYFGSLINLKGAIL